MSAEILNFTPISGDFTEKHFGEVFNIPLWVKFTDNNFEDWLGCFPQLDQGFAKVLINSTNETALVVSGGECYLIDISEKNLLYKTKDSPLIESVIYTTNPDYFLVGASYCIYVFDCKTLVKCFQPEFGTDGIYFTGQDGEMAIGHLYAYNIELEHYVGFELDLKTFEVEGNRKIKVPFNFTVEQNTNINVTSRKENIIYRMLKRWFD